jgi:adenosylmethionine-8-amino-7-oxononanoate aminotransferase
MTTTQDWVVRSLQSVWHPCTQMQHHETTPLIPIKSGRGVWLFDQDGKRYLDAISSWWVNLFGHANPRINAALKDQLDQLEHAMLAGFTHEPVVQLSEQLAALTDHVLGHCFYASDGASAVEIALKMSYHSWRNQGEAFKQEFVCLQGSYHGETIGALGVTDVALFRNAYGGMLQPAHVVATPDARRAGEGETAQDVARWAAHELENLLAHRSEHIAAVIIEPLVQCASGMAMHDPLYLELVRGLCDRYQVHLIFDEIAVGCGRTGTFFACQQAGVWPDFLCLSKGISGGYLPLSLVMTRPTIYRSFYSSDVTRGFLHSHSYTGNPLACRAALATLAIFAEDDVLQQNRLRAEKLAKAFAPLASHTAVRHLRQRGMILAFDVEIADPLLAASFSRRFFAAAQAQELLLRPIGRTVYVMPPYIISDAEIALLGERVQQVLAQVLHEGHEGQEGAAHHADETDEAAEARALQALANGSLQDNLHGTGA